MALPSGQIPDACRTRMSTPSQPGPHAPVGTHHKSLWLWVMCLTGVDYFSTLAYQPSIAFASAGPLATLGTVVIAWRFLYAWFPRSDRSRGCTGWLVFDYQCNHHRRWLALLDRTSNPIQRVDRPSAVGSMVSGARAGHRRECRLNRLDQLA